MYLTILLLQTPSEGTGQVVQEVDNTLIQELEAAVTCAAVVVVGNIGGQALLSSLKFAVDAIDVFKSPSVTEGVGLKGKERYCNS